MKEKEIKKAYFISEEIYKDAKKLMSDLIQHNPGMCSHQKNKTKLSTICEHADVMCSKLEHIRCLLAARRVVCDCEVSGFTVFHKPGCPHYK